MSLYISLVCAVFALVLLSWWIRKFNRKYPEPPYLPGALPIIGHAYLLLGSLESLWTTFEKFGRYSPKEGGVRRLHLGPLVFYVLSDPDDVSTVLKNHLEKSKLYQFGKKWVGKGLLLSEVSLWKNDRRMLSQAFTKRALYRFWDLFNSQARRLVDELAAEVGKGYFDQRDYIHSNALETTKQTILGISNEENYAIDDLVHEIDELFDLYVIRCQKIWLLLRFLYRRSDIKKRQDIVLKKIKALCLMVIEKGKSKLRQDDNEIQNTDIMSKEKSVLDHLIEGMGKNKDDDIRHHLGTFIVASLDTTATALVNILVLIGSHPKVQEKMFKEIEEVCGVTDTDVDIEELPKLIYLEAVIKEALRLYPNAPFIGRTAQHDIKLKNYVIPSGETVICSIYGVHHHPMWGDDVEDFKPERWLSLNPPPASLFMGFSAGRRGCIGEQQALMVMKITLVQLIRRYIISSDATKLGFKFNGVLKPVTGCEISIELRS